MDTIYIPTIDHHGPLSKKRMHLRPMVSFSFFTCDSICEGKSTFRVWSIVLWEKKTYSILLDYENINRNYRKKTHQCLRLAMTSCFSYQCQSIMKRLLFRPLHHSVRNIHRIIRLKSSVVVGSPFLIQLDRCLNHHYWFNNRQPIICKFFRDNRLISQSFLSLSFSVFSPVS